MRPRPAPRLAARRAWLSALALVACSERQVTPGPQPAAPPPAPSPADPPPHRACGEAGETPTELPPRLAAGAVPVGRATLRPGESRTLGTSSLRYDRTAWIGPMQAGHRGPVLHAEIDRAEAGGGPWGHPLELHAGQATHFFIGPYRFDVRVAAGEPPAEVDVAVERDGCPAAAVIERSPAARSLWLSTEGIRQHTYDLPGELLQVVIDAQGERPRLDVSRLAYRQWFEPRPGAPRSVLAGAHRVTVDRVVPGPGTEFSDRWHSDGDARLHARLTIEPLPPAAPAAAVAPSTPCGDPGPARTTLPPALSALPAAVEARTLARGQSAKFGALTLEHGTLEVPAHGGGPYRVEATQVPYLQLLGDPASSRGLTGPFSAPRLARAGRELLRIEPGSADILSVRRATLTCPDVHAAASPAGPIYLWLSTIGHARVTVGAPGALTLQLHEDPAEPSLGLTAASAYFSRAIGPDLAGLAFTLDDHVVEIVDVVAGDGTVHDGRRWRTDALAPALHVQLKVSPAG